MAMSVPAFGGHSHYRNDLVAVEAFLAARHYARFFVFNLCDTYLSSDGALGNYSGDRFFGCMQRVPFEDHGPPLLGEMLQLCSEATRWCRQHRRNVVAIHCKGGKGRTGVMVMAGWLSACCGSAECARMHVHVCLCGRSSAHLYTHTRMRACIDTQVAALLLWTGHRRSTQDALELFAMRRTDVFDPKRALQDAEDAEDARITCCGAKGRPRKNQGVDGPSQIRYIKYLEAVLYGQIDPHHAAPRLLSDFTLSCSPLASNPAGSAAGAAPWLLSWRVLCARSVVLDSRDCGVLKQHCFSSSSPGAATTRFPVQVEVWGDVRLEVYRHSSRSASSGRVLCLWYVSPSCGHAYDDVYVLCVRLPIEG